MKTTIKFTDIDDPASVKALKSVLAAEERHEQIQREIDARNRITTDGFKFDKLSLPANYIRIVDNPSCEVPIYDSGRVTTKIPAMMSLDAELFAGVRPKYSVHEPTGVPEQLGNRIDLNHQIAALRRKYEAEALAMNFWLVVKILPTMFLGWCKYKYSNVVTQIKNFFKRTK